MFGNQPPHPPTIGKDFPKKNGFLFGSFPNSKSFQLLKRRTAEILFNTLHIERWAFDVEMLKVNIMLATIECPTQGYNLHLTETKFKGCGNAANTTGGSFS